MERDRTEAEKEAIAGAGGVDLTPRGVMGLYVRWREDPSSLSVAEVGALLATMLAKNWDNSLLERAQRDMLWTNAKEVQWAVCAGLKIAPGVPQVVFLIDKNEPLGLRVAGYFDEPAETRSNDMCCTVATLAMGLSVLREVGLAPVAERLKEGPGPGRVAVLVCTSGGVLLTSVVPVDLELPPELAFHVRQAEAGKKGGLH